MVSQSRELTDGKRRWKGITLDYDFLLEQDNAIEWMLCLTERELQVLKAAIAPFHWKTRYFSDTQEIDTDFIEHMIASLELRLDGYCMPCQDINTFIVLAQNVAVEMIYNRYDGSTPSSVNENAPDDYFDGDGSAAREMALCMALNAWSLSYIDNWLKQASVVLGLALAGAWFFAVPVLGWVACAVMAGAVYVTAVYFTALQNESAIEDVLCCWYDNLLNQAISRANWASAMALCDFDEGTDQFKIWQVLSSELNNDKQWTSFIDPLGNAYLQALAGVSDCPCTSCATDWTHEFLNGNGGAANWYVDPAYPYGSYDAVNDRFDGTNRVVSAAWDYWDNIWLTTFVTPVTITNVTIYVSYDTRYQPPTIEYGSIAQNLPTYIKLVSKTGSNPASGTFTLSTGVICRQLSEIRIRSTANHQDGVMTGYTRITRIVVSGVGTDPFI